MEEWDVIVIGSGFAGPVAAKKCADAGFKTLMIERSGNVGEKVISGLTIPIYGFLFGPSFIRDGNPPVERPVDGIINYIIKDIDKNDIEIDDSLMIPKPFSPIYAFGYNAYCKPFCEWEARKAVEAGAELRTSTVVSDVIMEAGCVRGVVLETGEKIRSRIVIDAEGSQGLVAVRSGIRKRYPPETISLSDVYDYEVSKEHLDKVFGFSIRFCWGWDEQRCAPPLGHGNGLMVWPYRESIHYMHDQTLRMGSSTVPNLKRLLAEYHSNLTSTLSWWKEDVASHARLRAHMWEGFEIYVGLDKELRSMPNHTGGMLLVGDAAGLESTEMCDGVPQSWISADIAAGVAIEALKANDVSSSFLSRYDKRIKAHPILQWSISGTNRFNLRFAQQEHDLKKLRKYIHNGWGLGALTHVTTPLVKTICRHIITKPLILVKWRKMFYRYYFNWHHGRFDYSEIPVGAEKVSGRGKKYTWFFVWYKAKQIFIIITIPLVWMLAVALYPLTIILNPAMKMLLPVLEPIYAGLLKVLAPLSGWSSRRRADRVANSDHSLFEV